MASTTMNSTGLCLAVPIDGKNVPSTIFYKDHHTIKEIEGMIRTKASTYAQFCASWPPPYAEVALY